MAFQDKTLVCKDCGKDFTFTVSEQEFYAQKGFDNDPVRCKDCRAAKKQQRDGGERGFQGGNDRRGERENFPITCGQCGKQDTVPFKPSGDRPVLCRDCFRAQRQG